MRDRDTCKTINMIKIIIPFFYFHYTFLKFNLKLFFVEVITGGKQGTTQGLISGEAK